MKASAEQPIAWALRSFKNRGVLRTVKVAFNVLADLEFDLRYGTDTAGRVAKDALPGSSSYSATKARAFRALMQKLDLPKASVFVDLGSGKGRVLLLAAQYGFEKVIGVEYSKELCVIARANVKTFARKTGVRAQIEVVQSDVVSFRIEPEQSIFFLYNPFGKSAMAQMLGNLEVSVARFPRPVWLIYNTPVYDESVGRLFPSCQEFEIGGTEFKVYSNE